MNDGMTLWRERVNAYWNMAIRYLRLIGNSGFLFTVYVLIIIGSYYYSVFLDWLPHSFPAVWVFVAVFAHLLTRSDVRTFVKPADVVFLLPYESKLGTYFKASKWYTTVLQCAVILLVLVILSPLFSQYLASEAGSLFLIFVFLTVAKIWNVFASWEEQRFQGDSERHSHFLLRGIVNITFTFFLFSGSHSLFIVATLFIMLGLWFLYYKRLSERLTIKWDHLIEVEQAMLLSFYRVANAFTDVPQLKNKVRPRHYLNWLINGLTDSNKSVYHYLFSKSFIRSNDYGGIYIRLVFIAAIVIIALPSGWLQLVVLLLFLHMMTTQLSTLWYHYDTNMWVDLYPVDIDMKKNALSQLTFRLLIIMSGVQVGVLLVTSTWQITATGLVIAIAYAYIGSQKLVHKRRK
ncbi:ABC transporter permease [Halalkalibacter krulwichiae]|uniref:Bacterial ABC transporter protein EcsB n=1 Tax=Halalkalibacter krulwichiae TaxID=199441 RepID=A0A1X9M6V9_9BACI|nr:ABC transporter permease [Halalkalibacter krulwichiae]ARK29175.1 Bacterial ABC transporter protein EcsB [Halalkalibacter krulwichiae]